MKGLFKRKRIGELLVSQGFVSEEDLKKVLAKSKAGGKPLGEILVSEGYVRDDQLAQTLALQFDLPFYHLKGHRVSPVFFKTIPVELMYRYPFVPVSEDDHILTIAMSDPTNLTSVDELETHLERELRVGVSTRKSILEALQRSEGSGQVLKKIETDFKTGLIREDESGEEYLSVEKLSKEAAPVVRLVDTILLTALQKRASDIHIEAGDHEVFIKYRIDGILYPAMEPLDIKFHPPLISRIKVMSELDIAEKRVPQDGRFRMRLEQKKVDFRVSILPSIYGEDVVIRILDKEYITADIDELRLDRLGFKEEDLRKFRKSICEPYGMVLVTGPTGSGKTTTLYAAVTEINTKEDKIITIEDPVEYQLENVVQIPVNEKKGLTFARGLRSILRHDPDKVMVGEIRDAETAQIAIQSALTGHLVFTTVHANGVFDVIGRFINMGIEPYNFVSSLNCILAQRLVRNLCRFCKKETRLSPQLCEESGLVYEKYESIPVFSPQGCPECHETGFIGRKAITEFLDMSDVIRELILDRRPTSEIRRAAIKEGLTTLRQAGLEKVFSGETTLKEINRVSFID